MDVMTTTIAVAMIIAGVYLVHRGWRYGRAGRRTQRMTAVLSGWTLIGLAFIPWAISTGADKGATLAIIVLMLAGLVPVLRAGLRHNGNGRRAVEREPRRKENGNGNGRTLQGRQLLLRRIAVFLLAGPVSAAVALLVTASVFGWWNVETGSAANRLAATLLVMPLAWAVLAVWATYDVPLRRRSFLVFGVALAGIVGTMLSPGMT